MAIIGLSVDNTVETKKYFKDLDLKGSDDDMVKNPFIVKSAKFLNQQNFFYVLSIRPVYPQVFLFGYMLVGIFLFLGWFNAFLILPFSLAATHFLWSKYFYQLIFFLGLRKVGYKGKIKYFKNQEIIKRLLFGTDRNLRVFEKTKKL